MVNRNDINLIFLNFCKDEKDKYFAVVSFIYLHEFEILREVWNITCNNVFCYYYRFQNEITHGPYQFMFYIKDTQILFHVKTKAYIQQSL